MFIKEEFFIDENTGRQMKTIYYGDSEGNITSTVTTGVVEELDSTQEDTIQIEESLSEIEEAILETKVETSYISCLMELGNL